MTTPDLLPCPFCGGKAEYDNADTYSGGQWIACVECGAKVHSGYYANPDCHAQWNRRAPVAPTSSPAPAPVCTCSSASSPLNKTQLRQTNACPVHRAQAPAAGPAERKVVSYFPALYFTLYPMLGKIAYARGYCLAVHGSIGRDFDLIAVPWTDEAVEPMVLLEAMQEKTAGLIQAVTAGTEKPHGRKAWILELSAGAYLDISFTPRAPALPKGEAPRRSWVWVTAHWHYNNGVGSASVWDNGVWHTSENDGCGGENSQEDSVSKAMEEAEKALKRQGWVEKEDGGEPEAPPSSPSLSDDALLKALHDAAILTLEGLDPFPAAMKVMRELKKTGGGEPQTETVRIELCPHGLPARHYACPYCVAGPQEVK